MLSSNQKNVLQPTKRPIQQRGHHNPRMFITSEQNANALLFGAKIKLDNPPILDLLHARRMDLKVPLRSRSYNNKINSFEINRQRPNFLFEESQESYEVDQKLLSHLSYPVIAFLLISIPLLLYWFLGTSILFKIFNELCIYLFPLKVIFHNKDALEYSERKMKGVYDQIINVENKPLTVR